MKKNMMLSELASSFKCNKFEDHICKNANLNTKSAEITNEVIMCISNAIVRNYIYIKYNSIEISTKAFLHNSNFGLTKLFRLK